MGHIEFAPLFRPVYGGKTVANIARKVKLVAKVIPRAADKQVASANAEKLLPRNMEIELNPGLNANAGIARPYARPENTQPAENTMPFERTQALEKTLKENSLRPETVARANDLVADQNYPSDELLDKIAGVLAGHINGGPE
jgi:hypothetical protein